MKKEIMEMNKEKGIARCTTVDERWYIKQVIDPVTGLPEFKYVPSVTWVASFYPKGPQYLKWVADHGYDEAQALMREAGDKGSKIHEAISAIMRGEEVRIDSKFINNSTEQLEELKAGECDGVLSFENCKKEMEEDYILTTVTHDVTIYSDLYNYGGSIDWIVLITPKESGKNPLKLAGATTFIVDFKSSQDIWPSHRIQLSAYKKPLENGEFDIPGLVDVADLHLAILQVGYRRNKNMFKFTPIEDKFSLFLASRMVWEEECGGDAPKQRDYPIVLSPAVTVEQALAEVKTPKKAKDSV